MAKYTYLSNIDALKYVSTLSCQTRYVKILILDSRDLPIRALEGYATGGSININGSSAVRRSGSLTMVTEIVKDQHGLDPDPIYIMNQVTKLESLLSMNKRVAIEIGIKNSGLQYQETDIFWFPVGVFLITNATVTHNTKGISVSLVLKDKMALLNGEAGGTLTEVITHSPVLSEGKEAPVPLVDLIYELVTVYGEISPEKVIVADIPVRTKQCIQWGGTESIYIDYSQFRIGAENLEGYEQVHPGEQIGYIYAPFVYPGQLTSNPNETVTSVLDKIKNVLGNFEYFFDVDGVFHFQEIRNYLNEGTAADDLVTAINEKYFINTSGGRSIFEFVDGSLVTSYSNAPQYGQIKNDFTVWGKNQSSSDIRYHLILDYKPDKLNYYTYTVVDNDGVYEATNVALADETVENAYKSADWRMELYLSYLCGTRKSYHAKELIANFPTVYDIRPSLEATRQAGRGFISKDPSSLLYFFDIIDATEIADVIDVKGFSVSSIGRREKVISNSKINYLFAPTRRDLVFLRDNDVEGRLECIRKELPYITVGEAVYENLTSPAAVNAAYDTLRSALHEYLSFNNNINLSTIPAYHLDANMRISVEDEASDIHGDYMIQSISLPLTLDGLMTINAIKAVERL